MTRQQSIQNTYVKKVIKSRVAQYDNIILYSVVKGGSSREAVLKFFKREAINSGTPINRSIRSFDFQIE